MKFYDLSKEQRQRLVQTITNDITADIKAGDISHVRKYASDTDTYIRKNTYLVISRIYKNNETLREKIIGLLDSLYKNSDEKIRQTVAYTLGEIGKVDAGAVLGLLEIALHDEHHKVKNGVIGALKQMCEKNPQPTLAFASRLINHDDPKVRREIIHGIELHGRAHPEDVLPLLRQVQNDKSKLVTKMVIHVIGQISYKKGCLAKVIAELKAWDNRELVEKALEEIIEVHKSYAKFSALTVAEAKAYIRANFEL